MIERLAGIKIFRSLPGGVDLSADLHRWIPQLEIRNVFDVGANRGQSALAFVQNFPFAELYCFEPSAALFERLEKSVKSNRKIHLHRIALGRESGEQKMLIRGPISRIVQDYQAQGGEVIESISVMRLDEFCTREGVERIGLLKVDTEGHDLEVLRGADELLRGDKIDVVQVEAGMTRRNDLHVPFREFEDFLGDRGYLLFGFYDQQHEWSGEPQLRRADAAFVSSRVWKTMRWR